MPAARGSLSYSLVRRLGGLTFIRILSAMIPLATLPVIARHATTVDWAAMGVGTSWGTVGAVLVNLGWSLTGPPRVAGRDAPQAAEVFRESRASMLVALCVVVPTVAVISAMTAPPSGRGLAAATSAAIAISGLSVAWHIAARGRTRELATYDVIPRLIAGCASAAVVGVAGRGGIWTYPLALALTGLIGPFLYARTQTTSSPLGASGISLALRQATPALTGVLGATYSGLAIAVISLVSDAGEVAQVTSAFRVYLLALSAIVIINQATIHWAVLHVGSSPRELRTAGALCLGVGLLGFACFATVGPGVGRALYSDEHGFNLTTSWAFGVAFAALSIHTFVNTHLLLPFELTGAGLRATVVGVCVGIPGTLTLASVWGASGGAAGVALAEVTVAAYLVICVGRRSWRPSSPRVEA